MGWTHMDDIKRRDDGKAIQEAWVRWPGRVTNDNIHKDFVAGWEAGRKYEQQLSHQAALIRARLTNREDDRGEGAM